MVGQLSFEGMPRRLYSCTPSRLRTWLDCPRRYRMTYLDRPPLSKGPPWAHNSLGASVHNALANWWRLPRAERTVSAAGALLESGWIDEGYADDAQSTACMRRSRAMVQDYAATLDPGREPVGVERTVATKTELIAVSGRIDRLDDRDGELVVVDYKTGRHAPSADDARSSLTLALYALAAARVLRRECHKVELHHLPTGQIVAWEHTGASLDRHLRRAEDVAGECAAADERFGALRERAEGESARASREGAAPSGRGSEGRATSLGGALRASGGERGEEGERAEGESARASREGAAPSGRGSEGRATSPGGALRAPGGERGEEGERAGVERADQVFPPTPGAWCGWCDFRAHCQAGQLAAAQRRPWDGLDAMVSGGTPPDSRTR